VERDLTTLSDNVYDVVVIGGGIYGACVAWDAVLRGLTVALVEKGDFGSATSANSLKIIHGGFRYLQNFDLRRMRSSINERKTLMRIAPHLIHPLPVLIPTFGHGVVGREVMTIAMILNDLVGIDRNQLDDPQKLIPRGRSLSRDECLSLVPRISRKGLNGGVIFYDAQVYNSERLVVSFLRAAANAGGQMANYLKVIGLLRKNDQIRGVEVEDQLSGRHFTIRAGMVVNTTGPWINQIWNLLGHRYHGPNYRFAKAVNIVTRPLFERYAVGLSGRMVNTEIDPAIRIHERFFFAVPWRGKSMIGTNYLEYDDTPDKFEVKPREIQTFLDMINQIYPAGDLKQEDITFVHGGLVPISGINPETGRLNLTRKYWIHDHRLEGVEGLLSVVGVKYTTARYVAEKVVDHIFNIWGKRPPESKSSQTPIFGGTIERFRLYSRDAIESHTDGSDKGSIDHLIYNYGAELPRLMNYLDGHASEGKKELDELAVLKAEVIHAVREEMALKLSDAVFRRTDLGTAEYPEHEHLRLSAEVMAAELGWGEDRIQRELEEVNDVYICAQ
jgi:glycerol-3-phosphate dehydrogenase